MLVMLQNTIAYIPVSLKLELEEAPDRITMMRPLLFLAGLSTIVHHLYKIVYIQL